MTTTNDESEVDAIVLACNHCRENSTLRVTAVRLTLYSHGLMTLRFFCTNCYDLACLKLASPRFAESLSDAGVPTSMVRVPAEMSEHPSANARPINENDCRYMEAVPITYFNEHARRELRLR